MVRMQKGCRMLGELERSQMVGMRKGHQMMEEGCQTVKEGCWKDVGW